MLGYAQLSKPQVASCLTFFEEAFDLAVRIKATPTPFSFKLNPNVRPYVIEGAREMIDEGNHREAMFWLTAGLFISFLTVQADASPEEQERIGTRMGGFLADLGFGDREVTVARVHEGKQVAERVIAFSDEVLVRNPEICE